ncbi:hypothetical protein IEQ34_019722 [Dendrobium chrysotoxum]|uniref:Uncharacterized protein n=1 Tax=Dendrobium chrysotoxum TaxID=161865 RepID=A0AAV7G992_DENCH|nr:hypothetical protein IEQ34_019722 [Dendrobium chrysotoxum]
MRTQRDLLILIYDNGLFRLSPVCQPRITLLITECSSINIWKKLSSTRKSTKVTIKIDKKKCQGWRWQIATWQFPIGRSKSRGGCNASRFPTWQHPGEPRVYARFAT